MSSFTSLISSQYSSQGKLTQSNEELSQSIKGLPSPPSNADIAEFIIVLSNNSWDGEAIGKALKLSDVSLDWKEIFRLLEISVHYNNNTIQINFLVTEAVVSLLKFIAFSGDGLINSFFAINWTSLERQISLVSACLYITPEIFDFKKYGLEQIVSPSDYVGASPYLQSMAEKYSRKPLNFYPLIYYCLQSLSQDNPQLSIITTFLDHNAKLYPVQFFLGGVAIPKPWPELLERVLQNFFELFIIDNAESTPMIFYRMNQVDKEFFHNCLLHIFSSDFRDPSLAANVLKVSQDAGVYNDIIDGNNYTLILEISALADKSKLISFGDMLKEKSRNKSPDFIRALLDFLEIKATIEYSQNQNLNSPPGLSLRTVAAGLQFLNSVEIPAERLEQYKSIQIQCLQSYPRLINFGQGYDEPILSHGDSNSFSPEVERKMKTYYQQMYEQHIEIRDIITMLQRLKQSSSPEDQDTFACMVHSLFDEYRFFPEYPLNALATTAVLFGSLVYFQLIDGMPLSIALRFILDSLRQPVDSNMFKFGLQALFEFRERLPEFPKYCHILLEIPGLALHQQFFQQIKDIVGRVEASQNTLLFSSVNPEMAVANESAQEEPQERIRDKVLFNVNNLATSNVEEKCRELASLLEPRYFRWFASYIVLQRVQKEPNNLSLYITVLNILGNKVLENYVHKVTLLQIANLINNPDTASTPEKRTMLKTLGSWLGKITLARNKPILHNNIAFKKLLCEGFDSQTLPAILPFVCKVLEKAAESIVFKPPNPWVMGIIKVLVEFYQFADLKLNLKFEVELLCNTLKITLDDIEPSFILRNHIAQHHNMDTTRTVSNGISTHTFEESNMIQNVPEINHHINNNIPAQLVQQGLPTGQPTPQIPNTQLSGNGAIPAVANQFNDTVYTDLAHRLVLVGGSVLVMHPALKRPFMAAIEKSLQDVLQPVVDRSASMACYSTSSLILKDFALEPDENKVRLAAQRVVERLAGNIAIVTAKDLLREALATHIPPQLAAHGYADKNIPQEQIEIAIADNIDVICTVIERAAIDRSIVQIEEALHPAFVARQRYYESGASQPFADQVSPYALQLPEPFRLKLGGLDKQQFAIYEDFGKNQAPYDNSHIDGESVSAGVPQMPQGAVQPTQYGVDPQQFDEQRSGQVVDTSITQINTAIENLAALCREATEKSLNDLTPEHKISVLVSQILTAVNQHAARDTIVQRVSHITLNNLYTTDSDFTRDVYSYLLEHLCSLSSNANKEITFWILFSEDPRKYNALVTVAILKSGLISCADLDVSMSKEITNRNENVIPFAVDVVRIAVLGPEPCALRTNFASTLDALSEISKEDPQYENITTLLDNLGKASSLTKDDSNSGNSTQSFVEQMNIIFAEWVRLTQHPARNERQFSLFIYQLSQYEILSKPEYVISFIRCSFEFALNYFERSGSSPVHFISDEPFIAVDGLAKMISSLALSSKGDDLKNRVNYIQRLIYVISLVVIQHHEKKGEEFNEQPYFRFFSTLFFELNRIENKEPELIPEIYLVIADIFKTLQPFALPGFSFAWMSLISHRYYLPKLLDISDKRGWPHIIDFLCELLDFEGTYARGKDFPKAITVMYQGTARIFLALLHDSQELFVENHYVLCQHIPSSFVQLRNLVLSAFPEKMELPDPLTKGLRMQDIPEISNSPVYAVDPAIDLQRLGIKKLIDVYIKSPSASLLKGITSGFKLPSAKSYPGLGFDAVTLDAAVFNSLVFYIGIKVCSDEKTSGEPKDLLSAFNRDSPYLTLLNNLILELNPEGRYFLFESIANQLRYPNRHTHFFSSYLLSLFTAYGNNLLGNIKLDVRHQITRVLLERIICNRPHPWGLMVTFTELLKNDTYKIFDFPFTKSTPEIERMFTSLYDHVSSGANPNNQNGANSDATAINTN